MSLLLLVLRDATSNNPASSKSSAPCGRPEPEGGSYGQPEKEAVIPSRVAIRRQVDVDTGKRLW